ncbi:Catalase [Orchesella cincta]|uniref:Catalase n=1 Tax=Orchesella cincta TaxID=48709 RepID=A0A1D2NCE0_ORCCI|nr:Catalase [Orchesella cincta]
MDSRKLHWSIFITIFCFGRGLGYNPVNTGHVNLPVPGVSTIPSMSPSDPATLQISNWASQNTISIAGTVRDEHGCPVPSLTASLGIGTRGNLLLQDVILIDEIGAFNRHGAFGYFRVTHDISTLTKADFLNEVGKTTRVLIRVSTAGSISGSSDMEREGRGFAIKFYTADGNFDLAGTTGVTFPIRDPMLFTDLSRSRGRNPQTFAKDITMRWDFSTHRPEGILYLLKVFSDFGANSRVIDMYGVHAFKFVNRNGIPVFVKFHVLSQQPFRWWNDTELATVSGSDPDHATRDLYDAIANQNFPKWTLKIQVMTAEQALKYPVNPFDATKVWRQEEFPLIPVGEIVLNENPVNVFNDIEQAAFSPARMVPGIEPSPDRLLIGRMFAYGDAQRYRLGVNYAQLAVNRPIMQQVKNYVRDGFMRENPNGGGSPNYFPNSFHGPTPNQTATENVFHVNGVVDRIDTGDDVEDNFRLARLYLYKDLTVVQRRRVAQNLGNSLAKAIKEIREKAARELFFRITPEFGKQVWDDMQAAVTANNAH